MRRFKFSKMILHNADNAATLQAQPNRFKKVAPTDEKTPNG